VRQLSLVLKRPQYDVASLSFNGLNSHVSWQRGDFSLTGTLDSVSLRDLTDRGALYQDRVVSRPRPKEEEEESSVLSFHYFRHGTADPLLKRYGVVWKGGFYTLAFFLRRDYDILCKLRLSSIAYVHTHRFYSEVLSFFFQFHQMQCTVSRAWEVLASDEVKPVLGRGSRIRLDVEANSPLMLLPISSKSKQLLALDMGFLELSNVFK